MEAKPIVRWVLTDKITGKFIAVIYAERFALASDYDRTLTIHFWWGDRIVALVDQSSGVNITDSGGRPKGFLTPPERSN
jgi:hypothetical protein